MTSIAVEAPRPRVVRDYLELSKSRIVLMVLITTAAGFLFAPGDVSPLLMLHTLVGTALGYRSFGGPEVEEFFDRPELEPGPTEVRIDVTAAGVNPTGHHLRAGHTPELNGNVPFPQVIGVEAACFVTAVGAAVDRLAVGERVFGLALTGAGTYATSTLLLGRATAHTPNALSDVWAGHHPGRVRLRARRPPPGRAPRHRVAPAAGFSYRQPLISQPRRGQPRARRRRRRPHHRLPAAPRAALHSGR